MPWSPKRYRAAKKIVETDVAKSKDDLGYYMGRYKEMIEIENFEAAKAITDVLEPFNYYTKDTHQHIKKLNKKTYY